MLVLIPEDTAVVVKLLLLFDITLLLLLMGWNRRRGSSLLVLFGTHRGENDTRALDPLQVSRRLHQADGCRRAN